MTKKQAAAAYAAKLANLDQAWTSDHQALHNRLDSHPQNSPCTSIEIDEMLRLINDRRLGEGLPRLDLNAGCRFQHPALLASRLSFDHLEVFIKHGFDPRAQIISSASSYGTLLHAPQGHMRTNDLIEVMGLDPNAINPQNGSTPLHAQTIDRDLEAMSSLIAHGAKVNARNLHGNTPLMSLALHDRHITGQDQIEANAIEILVRAGADIMARNEYGCTALHFAAQGVNARKILELVRHGGDLDAQDNKGMTPLHHAVIKDRALNAMTLVALGASPRGVWSPKATLHEAIHGPRLMCALQSQSPRILQAHLENFPSCSDEDLAMANAFSKKKSDPDMAALLHAHQSKHAIENITGRASMPSPI